MPGLDRSVLTTVDHRVSINRINHDIRSDFIYAPHFEVVFRFNGDGLWDLVHSKLASGRYQPELPITIRVPKPGGFTRPGSILGPPDRLVYQFLADLSAEIIECQIDRKRVFSNVFSPNTNTGAMFAPHGEGFTNGRAKIQTMAEYGGYFVVGDIAHYFERIPQHNVINLLRASGVLPEVINLLEELFLSLRERVSFGIIQGVYPSDLFGDFYLSDLDTRCELNGWDSARFVDDFYIHFEGLRDAERGLSDIIDALRRDGLNLNENKSGIREAQELIWEESELDRLINDARDELDAEHGGFEFEYGFATEWGEEPDEEELHVASIESVYSEINKYPRSIDKIERFCLPILRTARSPVAVERALAGITERPYLSRYYLAYLAELARTDAEVSLRLQDILEGSDLVFDFQRHYLIAALLKAVKIRQPSVLKAVRLLQDPRIHPSVRAIAAIFAARHGTPQHRRTVRTTYENEASNYVRTAILYSSIYFTSPERRNCIRAWGGHNEINTLVASAIKQIE